MQRPASRGGPPSAMVRGGPVAPKGAGGAAFLSPAAAVGPSFAPPGMRPPTCQRPGSSAGVPVGMRPPTSGGLSVGSNVAGVPLHADVQVAVRPVTGMASGVSGMPTKSLGPGRVIADKSYYLTDLN